MFLENLKTRKSRPFVYGLSYDEEKGIIFKINPMVMEYLKRIPIEKLLSDEQKNYLEKGNKFEPDIQKNFGFNNCSNYSFADEVIDLSFPVITKFISGEEDCHFCHGDKVEFMSEKPCYHCRGTGKEFLEKDNTTDICFSLKILIQYLNWFCIQEDDNPFPENNFGIQNIFLELDSTAGISGEYSLLFVDQMSLFLMSENDDFTNKVINNMFILYQKIEGKEKFPNFEFFERIYQFRCEFGKKSFYLEVPGQNGCSIHRGAIDMSFSCHNVDTRQQHICLLAGLASLVGIICEFKI